MEMETINAADKRMRSLVSNAPDAYPIIVHSHLKWDWVWQRPQQFLSRLSKKHRVLFVEAPDSVDDLSASKVTLREVDDYPNVVVLQMQIPAAKMSNREWLDTERKRLVQ